MPEDGWKSVTLPNEIYAELQARAEKNCRSVAKEIEYLLRNHKSVKVEA